MPRTLLYVALALIASGATLFVVLDTPAPATDVAPVYAPLPTSLAIAAPTALVPSTPIGTLPVAAAARVPTSTPEGSPVAEPVADNDLIELWDSRSLVPEQQDEMTLYRTHVPVAAIANLAVGKTLQLAVPGRKEPLRATLDETHNTGAAVWSAAVQGGQPEDSLTVVRGQLETHITLATRDMTLSFVVDNATGNTLMTDQNELLMRATPDALVTPESTPLQPLPPPTSG